MFHTEKTGCLTKERDNGPPKGREVDVSHMGKMHSHIFTTIGKLDSLSSKETKGAFVITVVYGTNKEPILNGVKIMINL